MIKLAVAVAPEDALPSAFVVWRGIERSMEKAARFGYDGIELALQTADEVDASRIAELLDAHALACPCVSTGQVFAGLDLYFTHPDAGRRAELIRVFEGMIDLASLLGAKVNIGRARGFIEDGDTFDDTKRRFIETARLLAPYAAERDVTLILEPVNRYEINFVNSLPEAAALIAEVGVPNLAMMPDLFHMNIEDRSLGGELERFASQVAYVHFADSNRLAPGQGHTDFRAVFESLKRMGFDGWGSVEILPLPDPDTAARQAIEYLAPFREEHNRA